MDEALHTAVRTNNVADAIARLDAGADINGANPASGETPLMITAKMEGRVKIAKMLIARGANVNAQNLDGDTVLHIAIRKNKVRMLQLFVTAPGINANLLDSAGNTPLTLTIKILKTDGIPVILSAPGVDVNLADSEGTSPLILAANRGFIETIEALLAAGANVNAVNSTGDTALMVATTEGRTDIVQALLAAGTDVNIANNAGVRALIMACYRGQTEIVQALLAVPDIHVNAVNNSGGTALLIAALYGHMEIVEALLAAGAGVNIANNTADTPLSLAAYKGYRDVVEALLAVPGININALSPRGETPLILATRGGYSDIVHMLLDAGVDVNIADITGYTALITASFRGYIEIIKDLLEHGADINAVESRGFNALYLSALNNRLHVVELLLDIPELDKDKVIQGKTILQWAQENKFAPQITTIIIQKLIPQPPMTLWKGWTRIDAEKFDTIFGDTEANNYSCCPVCLKYVGRAAGCMYMLDHNCANFPGYYNRELYDKYKNPEGIIYWCTICGRICLGHRHYALGLADGPVPELLTGFGDPFSSDCSKDIVDPKNGRVYRSNEGGGLPEKAARFRRLREYALECQDYIDQRPAVEVLDEMVEEMWNTPFRREKKKIAGILGSKAWNIPSTAFPLPPVVNNAANAAPPAPAPEVKRPAANAANPDLQPVRHEPGIDSSDMGEEKPLVIQFRHRMANGEINNHVDKYIGVDSLVTYLRGNLPWTGYNPDYGLCWNHAGGCTARLYPEEVQPFIPADLYEAYKDGFNRQFQVMVGGSRKRRMIFKQQTRKLRGRKQRGGNNEGFGNIFVEAEDAKCYLPSKQDKLLMKVASTRNNRKKGRKTRKVGSRR